MKKLILLLAIAVITGCGTAAAQTEPDTYLADIRAEATRTAQLNDRSDALLTANEALSATAAAAYASMGDDAAGLKALSSQLSALSSILQTLLQNPVVDQSTVDALLIQVDRLTSEMAATKTQLGGMVASLAPTPGPSLCDALSMENLLAISTWIDQVLANRIRVYYDC